MRKTALEQTHIRLGARMVPFAGFSMPVQYGPILDEVRRVRTAAGLFDLGHMGRVRVFGKDAEAFLQRLQTNDVSAIKPGRIRYAMILNEQGLTQDDILVYRNPDNDGFFVVINAGNASRDLEIMRALAQDFRDVVVEDCTEALGMIAIQGPLSLAIAQRLCDADLSSLGYYAWTKARICGTEMEISRTGYTGEDGFEVYIPDAKTVEVWEAFLAKGKAEGLAPIGLGARDTLRHEAGMPLYGHEIDETTNPLEAGLGWGVKFTHDFVGREALEKIRDIGGTGRRLVGLTSGGKRCPRQGYPVCKDGQEIGKICSGNISPTLETNIATAYVRDEFASPGTELEFLVKGKPEPAVVREMPFYKRSR
ncbi:MAG: glycine cleavage system aminomethyltransferase GcvT [Planctomycetota bacterium]